MENNLAKTLPKSQAEPLPGTLHPQYIRCGRAGCKCASGELHGPYHYRFYREGGKLHKQYVKRADVASVKARCRASQQQRAAMRRILQENHQRWRQLMAAVQQLNQEGGWPR
jgi:hypothetical protein